jgi:hypothetical protein
LVDHVSDELDAGCAANLVIALEAAFEVENETFEQQLANIGKLQRRRSSIIGYDMLIKKIDQWINDPTKDL